MSEMVKSPGIEIEPHSNASSSGWSLRKKIVVGIVFICLISGVIAGYYVQRSARLILALQDEMKKLNSVGPVTLVKLPMDEAYDFSALKEIAVTARNCEKQAEFLKILAPYEEEISRLANLMTGSRYFTDWTTGVESLQKKNTNDYIFDFSGPGIDYQSLRRFSNIVAVISRYYAYKGEDSKAAMLLMANVSYIRQYISHCKEKNGVTLLDAMMTIAMIGNLKRVVDKTKGLGGYDKTLFPLLKERWEAVDALFPMMGASIVFERKMLPSFFKRFNKRASKELGSGTVIIDEQWMEEQLDYYYAPVETFELPYPEGQKKIQKYSQRIMDASSLIAGADFYWTGLTSPFKAVFQVMLTIAVPNYGKAYEKECLLRSDLRATYLSFAVYHYKAKEGEYPESLDSLKSCVKSEMLIDPYTGKQFWYKRTFDKVRLISNRLDGDVTFLDF